MQCAARSLVPALLVTLSLATAADARDRLHIVGSSTVFPYTNVVADTLAEAGRIPRPQVESTGTGGGFDLFCAGSGLDTPDITGASRPMKRAEFDACRANGVWPISQFPIGYDGLTIAVAKSSAEPFALTLKDIYTALAARVPVGGRLSANPYETWSDIRPELPNVPIRVIGPPPTSGTRDSFVELAMRRGCLYYPMLFALEAADPDTWEAVCSTMRDDGAWIEAGEDDEAIVADIEKDPNKLGIMGYGYLFEHEDTLRAVAIEGIAPDVLTVSRLEYPLARPLFVYMKTQHAGLVPGMGEFVEEYVRGMHPGGGYLFDHGLVPYFELVDFEQVAGDAIDGRPMQPPAD